MRQRQVNTWINKEERPQIKKPNHIPQGNTNEEQMKLKS